MFMVLSYKFNVEGYKLQVTIYKLYFTSYTLQAILYKLYFTSYTYQAILYKLYFTSYTLQAILYKLYFTSYNLIQWMPLNGIALGQTIIDPINRMITISEYVSFTKYTIGRHLGLVNQDKFDPTV
jgi:hypothetical protein